MVLKADFTLSMILSITDCCGVRELSVEVFICRLIEFVNTGCLFNSYIQVASNVYVECSNVER